ncbi:hypothetical protein Ddc_19338 [Ditylenchus destructor]|nr:hypothetical protein Ddc_19338 [Ditylenchus destructor]
MKAYNGSNFILLPGLSNGFSNVSDIKRHISAEHIDYFPCKCFTCKARGIKHETVTAELMYEHTSTVHEGIVPDVRLLMTRENELTAAIEKCRRLKDDVRKVVITIGDTLTDTGNGAIENVVISTEIEREGSSLEVHENTNNDSIGPTHERPIYGIQPENATTRADEMHFNANLQGLIHSIKAESSFREDEPVQDVNGQEITEVIDSQIPPVPTTEPTAIVETLENVTNPISNSENTSALSSYVPISVEANETQHSSVAITTGHARRISLRNPILSPERRYPKRSARKSIKLMDALNNDLDDETIDSQIPLVSSTEPTAIVETQENVTNPTTNSENTLASNAMTLAKVKPGSGTTTIVPGELRLEAALNSTSNKAQHSPVAMTTSRTPSISLRKRRNVSSISVESPKRKFLSHVPIDVEANEAQHNSAITTGRRPRILLRIPRPSPERRYPTRSARRSTIEASMEALNNDEDDERKQPLPEPQNVPPIPQNKRIPRAKSVVNEPHYNLRKGLMPQPQCAGNMSGPEEKKRRRAKTVVNEK